MTSFVGDYPCKLDPKGRLSMPSGILKQMGELQPLENAHFVLRKDIFESCLVLLTQAEWERQNEVLRSRLNPYNKEHSLFLRTLYRDTADLQFDANFRLLIPRRMLDLVGIDSEIVLAGQDTKLEIWAKEKYYADPMNEADFASLAQKLLG